MLQPGVAGDAAPEGDRIVRVVTQSDRMEAASAPAPPPELPAIDVSLDALVNRRLAGRGGGHFTKRRGRGW